MSDLILNNHNSLHKKSERLAAALFLVSNVMVDTEILKTRIRSLSLDLVSVCVSIKDNNENNHYQQLRFLEKKVLELVSLLNITSISGLISEMNACVLKKEFELFLGSISELAHSAEVGKFSVNREFFENGNNVNGLDSVKDNFTEPLNGYGNYVSKLSIKDKVGRKNQRNKDILNLIIRKGNVSIKDIASFVKGCSEKTVQRELNLLIQKGLIKKIGERRWSRYSPA